MTDVTFTTPTLETVEQEPARSAVATLIWLHGLGADGHDFASLPPQLGISPDLAVRYVFPHAPVMPVTLNMGMEMRAWYDIVSLEARGQDEVGIRRSAAAINGLVAREIERGVAPSQIVLGGFSQGGAVALYLGLRYSQALAGIIGLSTYLPVAGLLATEAHQANRDTPIFLAHGLHDPVLALHLAERSRELLTEQGFDVTWRTYPMPHSLSEAELVDLSDWLDVLIKAKGPG